MGVNEGEEDQNGGGHGWRRRAPSRGCAEKVGGIPRAEGGGTWLAEIPFSDMQMTLSLVDLLPHPSQPPSSLCPHLIRWMRSH